MVRMAYLKCFQLSTGVSWLELLSLSLQKIFFNYQKLHYPTRFPLFSWCTKITTNYKKHTNMTKHCSSQKIIK